MLLHQLFNIHCSILRSKVIGLMCAVAIGSAACAQVTLDSSKISIQIPHEISFCIDASTAITPDSIWGGTPPYMLIWRFQDGSRISGDTLNWLGTDSAHIELLVHDAAGRFSNATITLNPYPAISASFTANAPSGCSPFQAVFASDYLAFQHLSNMAWDFGDGASSSSMASVIHEYTNPGEFHPTLTITDNHGCRYSDTLNVPMRVFPSPQAKFKIAEQQLYLPETTVHILNQSDGASTFLWRFDHFGQSTENAPKFDFPYNTEGRYEISLTAKNTFGCYSEAKHEVTITQDISLFMPNAFTPDGDGVNDSWGISGLGVDAFRFNIEIYDAWGVVVFASEDIQAQWFGESASTGENAHPGMYNYRVLARDTEHGVGHLFEGHVQLLR